MLEGKFWCFTDFDLTKDYSKLDTSYLIYGVETCQETGKQHHQGYCEFHTNRKRNRLKKFNESIHWEKRQGSGDQATDYCKKEGKWYEYGSRKQPLQGQRTDIILAKKLVKDGAGMAKIIDECHSYQAIRMAELSLKYNEKERDWAPEVFWFYGATGSGKTRQAVELCKPRYWISGRNLKWWEGYDAHENIIIDDFRKDFCTFHELLRILDRYPYRLEVKGTSRQLLAKKIFITSCFHPNQVYETREDIRQLTRRISSIQKFEIASEIEVTGNTDRDFFFEHVDVY